MDEHSLLHLTWHWDGAKAHLLLGLLEELPGGIAGAGPSATFSCRISGKANDYLYYQRFALGRAEGEAWWASIQTDSIQIPASPDGRHSRAVIATRDLQAVPGADHWLDQGYAPFLPDYAHLKHCQYLFPTVKPDRAWVDVISVEKARDWLKQHLYCDLADEHLAWLGSITRVRVDPVYYSYDTTIVDDAGISIGFQRVAFRFQMCRGFDPTDLEITVVNEWPEWGRMTETKQVDEDGIALIDFPMEVHHEGVTIRHRERGIIASHEPLPILKETSFSIQFSTGTKIVETPKKKKRKEEEYRARVASPNLESNIRYSERTPVDSLHGAFMSKRSERETIKKAESLDQIWFENEADEATEFLRSKIRGAQSRVLFADPYFNADALQRFGHAVELTSVELRVLTSEEIDLPGDPMPGTRALYGLIQNSFLKSDPVPEVRVLKNEKRFSNKPILHDRFLVVDQKIWMLGCSFEDFGHRGSAIVRLTYANPFIRRLNAYWEQAQALKAHITDVAPPDGSATRSSEEQ